MTLLTCIKEHALRARQNLHVPGPRRGKTCQSNLSIEGTFQSKEQQLAAELTELPATVVELPLAVVEEIFIHLSIIIDQGIQILREYGRLSNRDRFLQRLRGLPPGPRVLTIQQPMFLSLACVCRSWYSTAMEHLYRDIYVSSYHALASLASVLRNPKNAHLLLHVRSFIMANSIFIRHDAGYTKEDRENLQAIYRVCPKLHSARYICPINLEGAEEYLPLVLKQHEINWCIATRLEVHLPRSRSATGKRPLLGPVVELPSLQELIIRAEYPLDADVAGDYCESAVITLPEMPQLRRLSINGWCTNKERLKFPGSGCPLLYYLELINCTIDPDQLCSITPDILSLESMVITGLVESHHLSDFTFDLIGIFGQEIIGLSHLCVPLKLFLHDGYRRPPALTPNLQHLVLTDESYQVGEDRLKYAEENVVQVLKDAAARTPCLMQRVKILTSSMYNWDVAKKFAESVKMKFEVLLYARDHALVSTEFL